MVIIRGFAVLNLSALLLVSMPCFAAKTQFIFHKNDISSFALKQQQKIYVAAGSFKHRAFAMQLYKKLKTKHPSLAKIKFINGYYLVYLGPVLSKNMAAKLMAENSGTKNTYSQNSRLSLGPTNNHDAKYRWSSAKSRHLAKLAEESEVQREATRGIEMYTVEFRKRPSIHPQPPHKKPRRKTPSYGKHFVATLSAGSDWYSYHYAKLLQLQPEIMKTYISNDGTKALGHIGLFLGIQNDSTSTWHEQYGLVATSSTSANLSGHIWEDGDPEFDNSIYNYKVSHTYIGLQGKILKDLRFYQLQPYASGSVGIGMNRSYGFNNTPLIFQQVAQSNFSTKNTGTFSYIIGLGLQKQFDNNIALGLGYEFSDWGRNGLGLAPNQTTKAAPSLNNFYTNSLLLNVSYLAQETK